MTFSVIPAAVEVVAADEDVAVASVSWGDGEAVDSAGVPVTGVLSGERSAKDTDSVTFTKPALFAVLRFSLNRYR